MSNSLKQDLRTVKAYVFQYLQFLRSNPSAELNINPYLLTISSKIQQCKN